MTDDRYNKLMSLVGYEGCSERRDTNSGKVWGVLKLDVDSSLEGSLLSNGFTYVFPVKSKGQTGDIMAPMEHSIARKRALIIDKKDSLSLIQINRIINHYRRGDAESKILASPNIQNGRLIISTQDLGIEIEQLRILLRQINCKAEILEDGNIAISTLYRTQENTPPVNPGLFYRLRRFIENLKNPERAERG